MSGGKSNEKGEGCGRSWSSGTRRQDMLWFSSVVDGNLVKPVVARCLIRCAHAELLDSGTRGGGRAISSIYWKPDPFGLGGSRDVVGGESDPFLVANHLSRRVTGRNRG